MNEHGMNDQSLNENEIRDLLGREIGEEPPIVGGPAAVFAGARSRVVRTRAVTGALSAVAVLGVATGAVAFAAGGGGAGGGRPVSAAGPGPATVTKTTPAGNGTTVTTSESGMPPGGIRTAPKPGPGHVLIDGRSVDLIVKDAVPAGLTVGGYSGQDSFQPERGGVAVSGAGSLDDGTGRPTGFWAAVWQNGSLSPYADTDCAALQKKMSQISDCRADRRPDGSTVLMYRQPTYELGGGSYQNIAQHVFPDGTVVVAAAQNYFDPPTDPHEKGWTVQPTRTDPLLTKDQVEALVLDARWGLTVPAEFAAQAKRDIKPYVDHTQVPGR